MDQHGERPDSGVALRGRFTTAAITRREDFTEDLWRIWLKPAQEFTFKPGQYCTIGVQGIERPYSIVSAPEEEELELFIERIPPPEGHLTPLLYELAPGDEVTLRPRPKGVFLLRPDARNHLFVATVTGVAPFISMLRHHLLTREGDDGEANFHVLEGASYHDELAYDREVLEMQAEHPNIRFVGTVSRPDDERNAGWEGETGRVNTIVERYVEETGLSKEDTIVYACGHPQMIEDVKKRLSPAGYRVEEERFWKED
ncbi:MAG: ferredoxin--NADP reductase [Chloroflexota bacterium]